MRYKPRFQPALTEWEPYADLDDPDFPSFAEYSMLGQCPVHGLERITHEAVGNPADPTALFYFQCGEIDPRSFG